MAFKYSTSNMPPRTVSYDLELRIPVLRRVLCIWLIYQQDLRGSRLPQIPCIQKTLHLYATLSDVTCPSSRTAGRRRSLNYEDINYIKSHCHLHNSAFLDELQSDLHSRCGVKVSIFEISMSTLFRTLRHLSITRKKVSRRALERNDEKRAAFDEA